MMAPSKNTAEDQLKAFVAVNMLSSRHRPYKGNNPAFQEDPDSKYTFDSERDASQSEICREGKKLSRKCIMVSTLAIVASYASLTVRSFIASDALNTDVCRHASESVSS